jgi:SAM-dependent methyltransferase
LKPSDWTRLIRLAAHRLESPQDYLDFQAFQAQLLLEYLQHHDTGHLAEARTLDLGCGHGGYARTLARSVRSMVGLDFRAPELEPQDPAHLSFVRSDALQTPFRDESFDLVICSSLIEHVSRPADLLSEIARVLAPGGRCYLSFPPYYSLRGGHNFSPFHLLGERAALRVHALLHPGEGVRSYATAYGDCGLFKMTIRGATRLLQDLPLQIEDTSTRWLPVNTARWPLCNEFLTWHVQFLLKKT